PFIAWNIDRVVVLRAGQAAPDALQPCCERAPPWLRGSMQWAFDRVGNPFEFPANAIFALRHGVELQRWDRVVGNYPVMPNFDQLSKNELVGVSGRWRVGFPDTEQYLIGAFSPSRPGTRPFRWTRSRAVSVLVPNIVPNDQHVTVWLAPAGARRVTVRWNGRVVHDGDLVDGWNQIGFTLTRPGVGEHELTLESELGSIAESPEPVGVAIHSIDLRVVR
ncbi:MAG TPA: hypothetical protein VK427_09455, partial [Kofleriaceae bacterium]|nr:hypothetical protein [Kofleriaceae bacterium]